MKYIALAVIVVASLFWKLEMVNVQLVRADQSEESDTNQSQPLNNAYFVSRNGNNQDGQTWDTAWNELDQIDWSIIQPGDVIYLDGGADQMQYETMMEINQSGEPNNPILIQKSIEEGHDGTVILFGGRHELLPYCGQPTFDNSIEEQLVQYGIVTNDHSYIEIDGMEWSGVVMHGFQRNGIFLDRGSTNVTVRYVEIYNNGVAYFSDELGGWRSDQPGVRLGGADMTFQRVIIHDNGQDAFQSLWRDNNLSNFRLEQSWIYNERQHPTVDESFNYCTHTDGVQIYDGGVVSGVTVTESVLGPGFTHNLILGQTTTSSGSWAHVHDVFLQDVLLSKAADNNINGYSGTETRNWTFDRVTIHCPKTKGHCVRAFTPEHSVTNSIFYGSRLTYPDGVNFYENNCIWQTTGFALGLETDPQFTNVSDSDHFSLDDYTVQNPLCIGSRLTSVDQLFALSEQE